MYHDLPPTARLLVVPSCSRQRSGGERFATEDVAAADACTPPTIFGSRGEFPSGYPKPQCFRLSFCCDRDGCRKRATPPSVRFLGPKGLLGVIVILISAMRQGPTPRRVRELSDTLRCRPQHHRPLADLLARTLSPNALLEDRTRRFHAVIKIRQPPLLAGGRLPRPSSALQGLDAPAAVSLADHGPRRPANQGLAMIAAARRRCSLPPLSRRCIADCQSSFTPSARRRDDPNTPQFDRRPLGAISILRRGLTLELSPCADRSRQRSILLPRRPGRIL